MAEFRFDVALHCAVRITMLALPSISLAVPGDHAPSPSESYTNSGTSLQLGHTYWIHVPLSRLRVRRFPPATPTCEVCASLRANQFQFSDDPDFGHLISSARCSVPSKSPARFNIAIEETKSLKRRRGHGHRVLHT
ncbi:hypothetical protein BDN70DRAFT_882393 [Pholiota conissans]|uniref:Secreted protein n=1 Tax=Pholiota conissans TaxID=109636 RepID=A0A9P5YXM1_9AGAR|nr:hypothetical protein BDN70DRAFT_882393 [Pholiota conissans]